MTRFGMTLPELAAALKHAGAYLGNDSGVGHLACAAGLPGLMLFGPSNPVKNAPNSRVMKTLIAPAEDGEHRDPGAARPVDISRLGVDDVWSKVLRLLDSPARDPARDLPPRLIDGPDLRWQHYVASTFAQPEPAGVTVRANLPHDLRPKVSVVIPAWNRAENALRAMHSALAQTEPSLEVLVIDDGSTDDTAQAFAELPPRVTYIRKPNGGASSARNAGLRRARGNGLRCWILTTNGRPPRSPGSLPPWAATMWPRPAAMFTSMPTAAARTNPSTCPAGTTTCLPTFTATFH